MSFYMDLWGDEPIPQGSKSGFVIPGTNRVSMADANAKKLKPWRKKVKEAAEAIWGDKAPLDGDLILHCTFVFPRLKSHLNADGTVKLSAPRFKHTKPDLDKLVRAIGDSLTEAKVIEDDSRFVDLSAVKWYGDRTGVVVQITVAP